ncbi:Oligo-1,6-glucosidase, partial [human gut metagenome]
NAFTVAEVFNNKEEELEEFIGENGHFSTMFDFSAEVLNHGDQFIISNNSFLTFSLFQLRSGCSFANK